jgi:hypothetical protein
MGRDLGAGLLVVPDPGCGFQWCSSSAVIACSVSQFSVSFRLQPMARSSRRAAAWSSSDHLGDPPSGLGQLRPTRRGEPMAVTQHLRNALR